MGVAHVRGDAEALFQAVAQLHALGVAKVFHKRLEGGRLHAAHANGADLFLVREDAHGGALGGLGLIDGLELSVGAHAVVVAVAADQGAVKTHVAGIQRGHGLQLGGEEILLGDAVAVAQHGQDRQLHAVLALVGVGDAAHEQAQVLAADHIGSALTHLVLAQVGQKVGDHEFGILGVLADDHADRLAVLAGDHSVELQGDREPLVFLDAAVVMGLQIGQLAVLIERQLLEVQAGGVHMGRGDVGALGEGLLSDHGQHQRLAAHALIYLVAGLELHAAHVGDEPGLLGLADALADGLALGARGVEKGLVILAVCLQLQPFLKIDQVVALLLGVEQAFAQNVLFFFGHVCASLVC